MSDPASDIKFDPLTTQGLEAVFDVCGTSGAIASDESGTSGTFESPGDLGHLVDATSVATYISTSEAGTLAGVDSRTVRRWYEQKRVRGHFSKGKLRIAREDLPTSNTGQEITADEPNMDSSETSGTGPGRPGPVEKEDPGRPGHAGAPVAFSDVLDRIERLSRENGQLQALLDEQRRENQELRLLVDSQKRPGRWERFWRWFSGFDRNDESR